MCPKRLRDRLGEARVEDDELHRGSRGAERLRDGLGRYHLRAADRIVKAQAARLATTSRPRLNDGVAPACRRLHSRAEGAAMAAEVDHGRLELAQLAEQIEGLRSPPSLELEPIA